MKAVAIKPSRMYRVGMFAIAFGALLAILLAQLPIWMKAGAAVLLFLYVYHLWQKMVASQNQDHIIAVQCDEQNQWVLLTSEGNEMQVALDGSSVRSQFFIQLNFRAQHGSHINVTIFRDSVSKDGFRQLSKALLLT